VTLYYIYLVTVIPGHELTVCILLFVSYRYENQSLNLVVEHRLRAYKKTRLITISDVREDGNKKYVHKIVAGKREGEHSCKEIVIYLLTP